jgi:hypothetical protein
MAILWPVAVGKPADTILLESERNPITYKQNRGLDKNNDGKIPKEVSLIRRSKLEKGLITWPITEVKPLCVKMITATSSLNPFPIISLTVLRWYGPNSILFII